MLNKITIGIFLSSTLLYSTISNAAEHPNILVTNTERAQISKKIETQHWATVTYTEMKKNVDQYLNKVNYQPDWLYSKLAMNWNTKYTTAIIKDQKTVSNEGTASVATPMFAGSRDWKTDYKDPEIMNLKSYNDFDGKLYLERKSDGKQELVIAKDSGHSIENINRKIMKVASESAYLYWITKNEEYAKLAADVLWVYMRGFDQTKSPIITNKKEETTKIIGVTSQEVIHEDIVKDIAITYDFLRDYLNKNDKYDTKVIDSGLKRFADRIIDGGEAAGNWNLFQAKFLSYIALSLEENEQYSDNKGREYYSDIVLNAELPNQLGINQVIKVGYDQSSGVWPEAPSYAFDTTANIIEIASILSSTDNNLLDNPILTKAIESQILQSYPSGQSIGLGDSWYQTINTFSLESLLSWNLGKNKDKASLFSSLLQEKLKSGSYIRENNDPLYALSRFVDQIPDENSDITKEFSPKTNLVSPLNLVIQRNIPESKSANHSISGSIYGTKGKHMHANGLAIELFGAGHVLATDPGRGSSYWQNDHNDYYAQLPAHNTVIYNGNERYSPDKPKEAIFNKIYSSSDLKINYSYVNATMSYDDAIQNRTLSLVRIDDNTSFFFDVFKSKGKNKENEKYHDWVFHGDTSTLKLNYDSFDKTNILTSKNGNHKGYDFFSNEESTKFTHSLTGDFLSDINGDKVGLKVLMPMENDRTIFKVNAPANRAGRFYYPDSVWDKPTKALLIRQKGNAWEKPFVAVYEPYMQSEGSKIKSVEKINKNSWVVKGEYWNATLELNNNELSLKIIK